MTRSHVGAVLLTLALVVACGGEDSGEQAAPPGEPLPTLHERSYMIEPDKTDAAARVPEAAIDALANRAIELDFFTSMTPEAARAFASASVHHCEQTYADPSSARAARDRSIANSGEAGAALHDYVQSEFCPEVDVESYRKALGG